MPRTFKCENPEQVAARAICLAFDASKPIGMGVLEYSVAHKIPEDRVLADFKSDGAVHTDYIGGRMMKLSLSVTEEGVGYPYTEPNSEYQSWVDTYATYEDLLTQANKEINEDG